MIKRLKEIWHKQPDALVKKRGMLVSDAFKDQLLREKLKTVASNLLNTDLRFIILPACGIAAIWELCTNTSSKHKKII
jgi:hypothetical protein